MLTDHKNMPISSKPTGWMKRFRKDERGTIIIIFALSLPVVLGVVGLAVDVTNWYLSKREAQTAADAAALAGAYAYYQTNSQSTALSAAENAATQNLFTSGTVQTVTPSIPPSSGDYAGDTSAVEVVISEIQNSYFASLIFSETTTVRARAVAASVQFPGEHCVISLDETMDRGININGNSLVNLGCGVASNSTSDEAVYAGGSSQLNASPVSAVGQVEGEDHISGDIKNWQLPAIDPYGPQGRDLQVPTFGGCDLNGGNINMTSGNLAPSTPNGIFVICARSLSLKGNHDLEAGIYIFDGANLKINASANVTGDNVTLIFTGSGSDYGEIDINGGATIELSATNYDTTGAFGSNFQGILFYQDQNAPVQFNANKFNGSSTTTFEGAIYFPNQEIEFSGNNSSGSECLQIIANAVSFSGNAQLGNNCDADIDIDPIVDQEVVLVE